MFKYQLTFLIYLLLYTLILHTYQGPQYYLTNDTNDFILMIGVIHSMTPSPMATYTNIASLWSVMHVLIYSL